MLDLSATNCAVERSVNGGQSARPSRCDCPCGVNAGAVLAAIRSPLFVRVSHSGKVLPLGRFTAKAAV